MDIFLDNEKIFSISADEAKAMKYAMLEAEFRSDIKRRLEWIIKEQHLAQRLRDIRKEWEPKLLQRGVTSFPADNLEFARLAFAQSDYKGADERIAEAKSRMGSASEFKVL
jgi:hypothetical protein